jgi:hypothetical protein
MDPANALGVSIAKATDLTVPPVMGTFPSCIDLGNNEYDAGLVWSISYNM